MTKTVWSGLMAAILTAALLVGQQAGSGASALQTAIKKEVVDGDLKGAIQQYAAIAAKYAKTDRATAAMALEREAEAYQKLGDAQSKKIFEQVLKDYADQKEVVQEANVRLAALGMDSETGSGTRVLFSSKGWDLPNQPPTADGRYFAIADHTGNVVLHDLISGTARSLTTNASWEKPTYAASYSAAISRDGKLVAYDWDSKESGLKDDELWVVNATGDPKPRRIFVHPQGFEVEPQDWSPDGKWILVTIDDHPRTHQIGLISTQNGSLRLLKSEADAATKDMGSARFSPDGRYITYVRGKVVFQTWIMAANGTGDVPLFSNSSTAPSSECPVWTPDGSHVLFVSDRSRTPGLWSIRIVEGKPQGEPELLRRDFADSSLLTMTRDGSLLYSSKSVDSDIYVADLDIVSGKVISEPKRVNERYIGRSWGSIQWLPDGKALSYWNRKDGTAPDELVTNTLATGEERTILVSQGGGPGYSGWFPDGTLMTHQGSGPNQVFRRIDTKTQEVKGTWTLTEWGWASNPLGTVLSPDLMSMYIITRDAACKKAPCTFTVSAHELETGRNHDVFRADAMMLRYPSVSPDGRDLAFIEASSDYQSLMVVPTAGGTPRELFRAGTIKDFSSAAQSGPLALTWMPDGKHVLALMTADDPEQSLVLSFPAGGGPPEVSSLKAPISTSAGVSPRVSPDGRRLAFTAAQRRSDLWIMPGVSPAARITLSK